MLRHLSVLRALEDLHMTTFRISLALCAAMLSSTLPVKAAAPTTTQASEARQIAAEAYQYFYPLVTMDLTRRITTNMPPGQVPGFGPANAFSHMAAYPDASFRTVVRPNFDTLYSSAWLDLTQGPVILSLPEMKGRYYLMPMLDMWSNVFAAPGSRTSGDGAGNFAVTPPGWSGALPEGVQAIAAPTPRVWIIGRTQTNGPSDYAAVRQVQSGYKLTRLVDWGKPPVAPAVTINPALDMTTAPKTQVDAMKPEEFFRRGADLLAENPPQITDWSQLSRLERIGVERGKPFDLASLDPTIRAAVEEGAADGLRLMNERGGSIGKMVNGWQINTSLGVYGDDYFERAVVAQRGLGANQPQDAVYPLNLQDSEGKPVMGENRYVVSFRKGELPPADAFWSLTMYDAEGFPVANSLNRYALGDRDPLVFNADGSLDISVQSDDPGPQQRANWLPAPARGPISMTLRLYAPRPEALDGRWSPPPVVRR